MEDWEEMLKISKECLEPGEIWIFGRLKVGVKELFRVRDLHLDRERSSWWIDCRVRKLLYVGGVDGYLLALIVVIVVGSR